MKIGLLGCKGATLDLLNNMVSEKIFNIDYVITLPEHLSNNVSFYKGKEIIGYCKKYSIPIYTVKSHNLVEDVDFFKNVKIDLLLVIGWERLIPETILNSLGKFACGMHGSPYGLPIGRGRAVMNWSLITGHNTFITNLFRYNASIDSGDIIGFKAFEINDFDTISSLHAKNRISMFQLLRIYVPLIENDKISFFPQPPVNPTYYPKRTPNDSGIDWGLSTLCIYNLIRAVSPPYPPAYCFNGDKKISIFEAYPFDSAIFHNEKAGTIVDVMVSLNQFIIKTVDGSLLIKRFEGVDIRDIKIGDMLTGVKQTDVMNKIKQRYPEIIENDQREV